MHSTLGKLFNIKKTSLIFVLSSFLFFFFFINYEIYSALFFFFPLSRQTRKRVLGKVILLLNSLNCICFNSFLCFLFQVRKGPIVPDRTIPKPNKQQITRRHRFRHLRQAAQVRQCIIIRYRTPLILT